MMTNPKDIQEIIMTPIEDISTYSANTKQHPRAQVDRIAHSIATYGFDSPIVTDEEGVIIKGHGRYFASQKLGLKEVPVTTHYHLTEEEKRLSRIADNKVAESDWDTTMLWDEMSDLHSNSGMDLKDFGMRAQTAKSMFPDQDLSVFGLNQTDKEKEYDKYNEDKEAGKHDLDDDDPDTDATEVRIESFMTAYTGERRYLRHMPMVDYLNTFDKVMVGISGGKDSICGLVWCLENLPKDKVIPYFGDLGWGIDWPHAPTYIKMLEKLYDTKIICTCDGVPNFVGCFDKGLLQYGFPHPVSCWVRNHIKIRNTKAVQMQVKKNHEICVVLSVRWAESDNRRKTYSDRGILEDGNMFFGSPILRWTDTDVCKFLQERDLKLSTPYQHADRMGCILCPHENRKTGISVRKKFPLLWRQILEWHARGARRTKGELGMHHVKKVLSSVSDLQPYELESFAGVLSPLALGPREYEEYMETKLGGELPCEDYTRIPYDKRYHDFPNDVDEEFHRRAIMAPRTDCSGSSIFG